MIQLILMLSLHPLTTVTARNTPIEQVSQFQPCVWPNKCAVETPATAQFQPCVWPNKCAVETPTTAQFQPCVWPNKCESSAEKSS